MAFDFDRFEAEQWARRTTKIPVPGLKDYFSEGEKPVWIVQSPTGQELAQAKHAKERNVRLRASVESFQDLLSIKKPAKIAQAFTEIMGNVEAEGDTAWRTELLILGSVEPKVDYPKASMLHKYKPTEYYTITNEIIRLAGLGFEPGKRTPSGATKKSKAV